MTSPISNRSRTYHREVQHDTRTEQARRPEVQRAEAKQRRGEELTPHERGLLEGQRTTQARETTNEVRTGRDALRPDVTNNGARANTSVDLYRDEFEVEANVAHAEGSFGREGSALSGQGEVSALSAGASGEAAVEADWARGTVTASGEVNAHANLVSAEGSVRSDYGVGSTEVSARGHVGAEAGVNGEVVLDPLNGDVAASVGGEAFVGARASAELEQTLGPATATVGGEVFAGVGVEFEADVGFEDGKLSASFDVGAALGIGASLEFGVEVDVGAAVDTARDVVGGAVDAAKDFFSGW